MENSTYLSIIAVELGCQLLELQNLLIEQEINRAVSLIFKIAFSYLYLFWVIDPFQQIYNKLINFLYTLERNF